MLKRRDYHVFVEDVRRFRPLVTLVVSVLTLLPSLTAMVTQGLSPLTVLIRLAQILAGVACLVWFVSAVLIHYARIQATPESSPDSDTEFGS